MATRNPRTLRLVEEPEAFDQAAWEMALETRIRPMLRAFEEMSPREQILTLKEMFNQLRSRQQLDVLDWCVGCFFAGASSKLRDAFRRRVAPRRGQGCDQT
jgi:hypothetical protein